MASNSTMPPPLPNPDTPLAFLPPTIGDQLEASRYLYVASLGVAYFSSAVFTVGQDYTLVTRYPINTPTLVYFLSKIATLAYIVTSTIFQVGPVGSCQGLQVALGWCWAVAVPSTSLLFFLRVRAVFDRNPWVVGFFGLLWLGTLGGSITVPFAINGGHIATTNRCINTGVKPFSSVGIIINACNDTLIFIAISYNVIKYSSGTVQTKVKSFFGGRNLPYISRELLRGGQLYYFFTVGGNILTMAMILSPSIPPVLRAMFTIPNIALENSMACRVFRNIKLGLTPATPRTTALDSGTLNTANQGVFALRTFGGGEVPGRTLRDPVEITKTVEQHADREDVQMKKVEQGTSFTPQGDDYYV